MLLLDWSFWTLTFIMLSPVFLDHYLYITEPNKSDLKFHPDNNDTEIWKEFTPLLTLMSTYWYLLKRLIHTLEYCFAKEILRWKKEKENERDRIHYMSQSWNVLKLHDTGIKIKLQVQGTALRVLISTLNSWKINEQNKEAKCIMWTKNISLKLC